MPDPKDPLGYDAIARQFKERLEGLRKEAGGDAIDAGVKDYNALKDGDPEAAKGVMTGLERRFQEAREALEVVAPPPPPHPGEPEFEKLAPANGVGRQDAENITHKDIGTLRLDELTGDFTAYALGDEGELTDIGTRSFDEIVADLQEKILHVAEVCFDEDRIGYFIHGEQFENIGLYLGGDALDPAKHVEPYEKKPEPAPAVAPGTPGLTN